MTNHAKKCSLVDRMESARPSKKMKLSYATTYDSVDTACSMMNNCESHQSYPIDDMVSIVSLQSADMKIDLVDAVEMNNNNEISDLQDIEFIFEEEEAQAASTTSSISRIVDVEQLPDDLLAQVGSFLNVSSLKSSRLVSRRFRRVFSQDEAGWANLCERLWSRKVHVAESAKKILKQADESTSALEAFQKSCYDARVRHSVDHEELIYDPQAGYSTVWDFRFKGTSGGEWTSHDPWHAGRSARKMVFLADGSVKQIVEEVVLDVDDPSKSTTTSHFRLPFYDASDPVGVDIKWRFVTQPMDFPHKAQGAYIRLTVGGRDVPTYVVHRSPTGNWGFVMENCWGVFASFALPSKALIEATATLGEKSVARLDLLEDTRLSVTNRWQWREALLYNLGSTTLPDGPEGIAEFEQAWKGAVRRLQAHGFSLEQISSRLRV